MKLFYVNRKDPIYVCLGFHETRILVPLQDKKNIAIMLFDKDLWERESTWIILSETTAAVQ